MDWAPTEMMQAVSELGRKILSTSEAPFADLAEAGFLELDDQLSRTALLVEVGRATSQAPVLETLVLGAPAADGEEGVLTAALQGPGWRSPLETRVEADAAGRLTGVLSEVPAACEARAIVVPARQGLFAVDTDGIELNPQTSTDGSTQATVCLDATPARRLAGPEAMGPWLDRVHVGISAVLLGVAEQALAMTAAYTKERHQFGQPIGAFQAVRQRAADAWIDVQGMQVSLWRAAWLLDQGEAVEASEVRRAVLIARAVACEGAHRVTSAAQHLHGGMGFDRDYGLYRCYLLAKRWEFVLGGAVATTAALGRWHRAAAQV